LLAETTMTPEMKPLTHCIGAISQAKMNGVAIHDIMKQARPSQPANEP
jgi:hypothetical protein